jgi:hypothetical protein
VGEKELLAPAQEEAQEIDTARPALAEGEAPIEAGKKSVGPATFIIGIVYGL